MRLDIQLTTMCLYIFLLSPIIILLLSCERKCDSYTNKPLTGKIEEYFGVYKPGNWWVYNNKTGAKKDSMYLADYNETFSNNRTSCEKTQQRTFTIINSQLPNAPSLYVSYGALVSYINVNFSSNKGQTQSASFPQFVYFLDRDSIISFEEPGYRSSNVFDSISLNGGKYYNILLGGGGTTTFYFAKNKALVGWGNILDTFNLVSFKIF